MLETSNLKKILTVSHYTFIDVIRSKILVNVAMIGVGLVVVTFVAYQFTFGDPVKIALDFGLGTLSLSSIGIALFFGASLLSKEIEQRTVHMIISRPVPRYAFILGKLFGLSVVLLLNIMMLSILTLSVYVFSGGEINAMIIWAILFCFLESVIVLGTVVLLSLWTSQTLAILLTIGLYVVGHGLGEVNSLTFVKNTPLLDSFINVYKIILPALYKLNLKDFILYKQEVSFGYLFSSLVHGIWYLIALGTLSIISFNKKSLD